MESDEPLERPICWITWEDHRRSRELAKRLGAEYHVLRGRGTKGISHLILALRTLGVLWRKRHYTIIVQNPSRVLAAVAALLKLFLRYPLVVDRHSNFRLGKGITFNPAVWFVMLCSEFSLRVADLTIVTNTYLHKIVERKGGRGFVLTDAIPEFKGRKCKNPNPKQFDVFFVCTFSPDEPYQEVIKAANKLPKNFKIKISGNYKKKGLDPIHLPSNVELLGFIPTNEYEKTLGGSDAILALTEAEWCLVCAGYEAMGAGKPLIVTGTTALKGYYGCAACFVDNNACSIAEAITQVAEEYSYFKTQIQILKEQKKEEWDGSFGVLLDSIGRFSARKKVGTPAGRKGKRA